MGAPIEARPYLIYNVLVSLLSVAFFFSVDVSVSLFSLLLLLGSFVLGLCLFHFVGHVLEFWLSSLSLFSLKLVVFLHEFL